MRFNLSDSITSHQDINDILILLSKNLTIILNNNFVGIYLTGSLTYGDFDPKSSDIDFLVIMNCELNDTQRTQIKKVHDVIAEKYPLWANRIEGSYITQDMLDHTAPPLKARLYINEGRIWNPDPRFGQEWLLNIYAFYDCGLALQGPDPKELFKIPIDINLVREASKQDFYQEWEPLLKNTSALEDSHYQAYVILTLCRILYRKNHADVVSKKVASTWVKNFYPDT